MSLGIWKHPIDRPARRKAARGLRGSRGWRGFSSTQSHRRRESPTKTAVEQPATAHQTSGSRGRNLFHGDAFGQISWSIDVATP
jgi:hypothetical protein